MRQWKQNTQPLGDEHGFEMFNRIPETTRSSSDTTKGEQPDPRRGPRAPISLFDPDFKENYESCGLG